MKCKLFFFFYITLHYITLPVSMNNLKSLHEHLEPGPLFLLEHHLNVLRTTAELIPEIRGGKINI